VVAEVESSKEGSYAFGTNVLTLADCGRQIQLEFFLGSARERKVSLAKAELLIEVLTAFRDALNEEARLIERE
jgi:hypothetical protein